MNVYVCWNHLGLIDKMWHRQLNTELEKDKKKEQQDKLPSRDLYIFDDIHMDDDFNPRHRKPGV